MRREVGDSEMGGAPRPVERSISAAWMGDTPPQRGARTPGRFFVQLVLFLALGWLFFATLPADSTPPIEDPDGSSTAVAEEPADPPPPPTRARPLPPAPAPRVAYEPSAAVVRWWESALADLDRRGIPRETVSIQVDLPDGSSVGWRRLDPMVPASTLKLVTAAQALDRLGPDYTFRTEVWLDGTLEGNTLRGDVVIVGGGDPATSSRAYPDDPLAELRPWVEAIRNRGITVIEGDLVADDRFLAGPARLPDWPTAQLDRWYSAASGALNLNDNCVDVVLGPVTPGGVSVTLRPPNPKFTIENQLKATTLEKEHRFAVDRAPGTWTIRASGKFWNQVTERVAWITVPDPTTAFLASWRALLEAEGIEVRGTSRRGERSGRALLLHRTEHTLASTLPVLLKRSQNLYGDAILRVTDRECLGDGSFAAAGARAEEYFGRLSTNADAIEILDGSGLARGNQLDAASLVALLHLVDARDWGPVFWESLPIAAVDGTLRKRFRDTSLSGRLRAKTGTLSGVSGLAGGFDVADGSVRFAALTGGKGARVGRFRSWLDRQLVALDRALTPPEPPTTGSSK